MNFVLRPWQLLLAILAGGRPPSRRIASSLHPRDVGRQGCAGKAWPHAARRRERLHPAGKSAFSSRLPSQWIGITDTPRLPATSPGPPTNAFTAESDRPTRFSVRTPFPVVRKRSPWPRRHSPNRFSEAVGPNTWVGTRLRPLPILAKTSRGCRRQPAQECLDGSQLGATGPVWKLPRLSSSRLTRERTSPEGWPSKAFSRAAFGNLPNIA